MASNSDPVNDSAITPALYMAHWPGKDTPACNSHLEKLVGLAAIMGFHLSWTPCEGLECANCLTEAERRDRQ